MYKTKYSKKIHPEALLLLFALTLTSCSSGSDGTPENTVPTVSNVEITENNTDNIRVGDSLTGSYSYADAEDDVEATSRFRWLRNDTSITGATSPGYTLIAADSGQTITFEVTPAAATGATIGSAVNSSGIMVINTAPVATNAGVSVLPLAGNTISGILQVNDVDDDSLTYSIVTNTNPANGIVTIDNTTTGAYTYTHAGSDYGDSFTFWANDGELDSNIATITISTSVPETPASGLQAIAGDQRITLNWDAVPGADSYTVYWSNIPGTGTGGTSISNINPPFYHDGITNGANYYYKVTAVNAVGESTASAEVTATPIDILLSSLSFDDANLSACVNASGQIYVNQLTAMDCSNTGITSLVGIEHLNSLTDLNLYNNSISDVTLLAGMKSLANLNLSSNSISDVTPLTGMTNLTDLSLFSNNVSDLTPLAGITSLTYLQLGSNNVSDLTPLAGVTSLTDLYLHFNNISDVTPLAGMTKLINLFLHSNNISDVTPLAGMSSLTDLILSRNSISDVTPLAGITNLTRLFLNNNSITDLTPLAGTTSMTVLSLVSNNISDVTPLADMTSLTQLQLDSNNISDLTPLAGMTRLTFLGITNNSIGGQGVGNIDTLVPLTSVTEFRLRGNTGMSCNELATLITVLGSPPVNTDSNLATIDIATDGVNCTNP